MSILCQFYGIYRYLSVSMEGLIMLYCHYISINYGDIKGILKNLVIGFEVQEGHQNPMHSQVDLPAGIVLSLCNNGAVDFFFCLTFTFCSHISNPVKRPANP